MNRRVLEGLPSVNAARSTEVKLLTIEEAAALTRTSYGVVHKAVRSKTLRAGRAGRRIVIRLEALLEWVNARQEHSEGPEARPGRTV